MPRSRPASNAILQSRIDAAQGHVSCDLVFRDIGFLDVFSAKWLRGDIAVHQGTIVSTLDTGLQGQVEIDGKDFWLVPGFIDAHVHVESSLMIPSFFQDAVLPLGTTSAICDPHEIANVIGTPGIEYFLKSSEVLDMDLWVMMSSCVPATHLETNGGGVIRADDLLPLAQHPRALGLAEMMNMPGVLSGDEDILNKLSDFSNRPIDGHCPLLRGNELSAYAAAGISSCHESSELEEAREKLQKGISVWIREGSVAKDLDALVPLMDLGSSLALGFCTDDRNPLDTAREGHIDFLIRRALASGVADEVAYRSASFSVAKHYGLDRGLDRVGAIAPGFAADLVLLGDRKTCEISKVFKRGVDSSNLQGAKKIAFPVEKTVQADVPTARDLEGPSGPVHVIDVIPNKILTGRQVFPHDHAQVARLTVLERYGQGLAPANAYVRGFGEYLDGAIASSVGHDSHNLIVVGSSTENMRVALGQLIQSGGGFCVVQNQSVLQHLALPFAGLMSQEEPTFLEGRLEKLKEASRSIGCELDEPFLQLAFLSLPVIPSLKLTDRGLVDVDLFSFIDVRA